MEVIKYYDFNLDLSGEERQKQIIQTNGNASLINKLQSFCEELLKTYRKISFLVGFSIRSISISDWVYYKDELAYFSQILGLSIDEVLIL